MSCTHANIFIMDHKKGFTSDDDGSVQMVNRLCSKCYQHWYGPEGDVKESTRAEWDEIMAHIFDEDRASSPNH
jgi:hypothetical protein